MKLAMDLRCLPADGRPGAGIAHATRSLSQALSNLSKANNLDYQEYLPSFGQSQLKLRSWLKTNSITHLISPTGTAPLFVPCKIFPWVHDISIFKHPEWFPQSLARRIFTTHQFRHTLNQAQHIFAVSEFVKNDLMTEFTFSNSQITVTLEGRSETDLIWKPLAPRYALILGTVEPRKNHDFIIKLWPEVRQLCGDVNLVIAGQNGWGNISFEQVPWLIRQENISDEERLKLIQESSLVLVPSLEEGFGLVALEAMSLGCPVNVSDRGSLPEVVKSGGAVLPLDQSLWITRISEILNNHELSQEMSQSGKQRSLDFSWSKTADIMLAKIMEYC